jgi:hypothetical protein
VSHRNEEAALGVVTRERPTRSNEPDGLHSTAPRHRNAGRAPFPRLSFRRFYEWPQGLATLVGIEWRAAA